MLPHPLLVGLGENREDMAFLNSSARGLVVVSNVTAVPPRSPLITKSLVPDEAIPSTLL